MAVGVAAAGPAVTPVEAQELPPCAQFFVVGVRGSGQEMSGPLGMGGTVDPYVQADAGQLPADMTVRYSLPYAAAPVGPFYVNSVFQGRDNLLSLVRNRIANCQGIRIGLAGYSQGAHVIHLALERLTEAERGVVRGVLLLADPLSAGDTGYDRVVTLGGEPGTHNGGGVFARDLLPGDIQGRSTDFCISLDPVCDNESASSSFAAFAADVHTMYAQCCGEFPAAITLGGEFAQRLAGA
ncbi:MAG: cutinase family protein [Egibacteraceae bacterium]